MRGEGCLLQNARPSTAPARANAGSLNPQRSLCVFECRVSQTRPGARPQRSEVSPGGWDAVVAPCLVALRLAREHSATQRFTYARHFKSREGAQGRGGRTRSRRASAIEFGLPGRADGSLDAIDDDPPAHHAAHHNSTTRHAHLRDALPRARRRRPPQAQQARQAAPRRVAARHRGRSTRGMSNCASARTATRC